MGGRSNFKVPVGWVARGWRFEVETTASAQWALIAQHFGARRFAYNWALAKVKANLDARAADPSIPPLAWTLPTLRKAWNQAKGEVAPWWPSCSKEACASGITDLVAALHGWSASKQGRRAGARVGFPRFKSRRQDRGRVRFTTGAMRLEPDRRHFTLPVVGRLRSKENTRRLQRLLAKGQARVLSMTLSEQGGRLFVGGHGRGPGAPPPEPARCPLRDRPWHRHRMGWSHTPTTPLSESPIPRPGLRPNPSVGGSPGRRRAASSAPEDTAKRKPSWRLLTDVRPTCATNPSILSRRPWLAATARSWSRIWMLARWPGAWADARSGAARIRPGSAKSVPPSPTRPAGQAAVWWSLTAGSPPPRPITAAAAIWPTSASASEYGNVLPVGGWSTATPTPPATSVTGPDRSPTGMSSGVELPPRCRSWATTTGRLTRRA
jgi:hypothetical protein